MDFDVLYKLYKLYQLYEQTNSVRSIMFHASSYCANLIFGLYNCITIINLYKLNLCSTF